MFARTLVVLWLPLFLVLNEVNGHDPIHYETRTGRGAYNFGYDTGLSGSHQFHQESRDESGRVRGRYGYTDPTGKLRLVHYSSGSDGYTAWGDVPGPAPNPGFAPPVAYLKAPNDGQRVQYPQSPGKLVGSIKSTQAVGKTVQTPVQVVRQEVKGQIIEPILPVKGLPPPPVKGKFYVPPPPPVKQVVYVQPPPPPPPVKGQVIISPPPVKGKLYVPPPPPPPIKGQIILTPPPVKGQVILPPPPPPPPVKGKIYVPPPPPPPTKTKVFLPPPLPVKGQIVELPPPPVKGQVVELPPPPPVKGQLVELPPPPVKGQVVELPPPPPVKGKVYLPPPPPVKGKVYLPPPPPLPVKGQRIEQYSVKGQIVEPYSVKATVVRLPSPFPVVQSQQIVEQAPVKGSSVKGEVVVQSPQLVAVPPSRYPPSPVRSAYKRRVEISPSEYRGNYPPAGPYTRCWCE